MNYDEALEYIHSNSWVGTRLGLHRIKKLLSDLKNPQNKLKFIHVAGTNGKGSVCAMLASVLQETGKKVGLYTSPFLHCYNERMRVNGEMIGNQELAELTQMVRPFAEGMEEKPTEFDLNTAIAMMYFVNHQCDIVVLEVGLGGLLDATNVIEKPEAAVITAIGLDHTRELGDTIEQIAQAKAGIIKEDCDVVIYGMDKEAEAVFEKVCQQKKARLNRPNYKTLRGISFGPQGQTFSYDSWKEITIPLLGLYQIKNACLAIKTAEVLREKGYVITDQQIRDGLKKTKWEGRFQLLCNSPAFFVDGSHNPHGMKATVDSLQEYFRGKKIIFILGVMADKDIGQMIALLKPLAKEIITVTPPIKRAMEAEILAFQIRKFAIPARSCPSIIEGCSAAMEAAGKDGLICALGSLYMIDEIVTAVKKIRN